MENRPRLDLTVMKEKRIGLGLTHQQLAEKLSFKNASTYYKYENGMYAFKADQLPILAEILECEISNLFTSIDDDKNSNGKS